MTSAAEAPTFWQLDTTWDELAADVHPGGILTKRFNVGHPDKTDGPYVVWVHFPPGFAVAPHTHRCDYTEIILEGSQRIGRTWHGTGTVRIVAAGTTYGPLVAGPDGVTALVLFADRRAIEPVWARPEAPTSTSNGCEP